MLGKLFKYEFKNTAKVMLTIYGVLLFTTILASVSFFSTTLVEDNETLLPLLSLLTAAVTTLYIFSVFALFTVSYVYLCIHFYKTMYSEQGYLTHTLPVKPITLFNVKLATSFLWLVTSLALLFVSIMIIVFGASGGTILNLQNIDLFFQFMFDEWLAEVIGMPLWAFILFIAISMIFGCLSYLLMVFASISIGQLFTGHKVLGAFAAGIVINFIQQIIATMLMFLFSFSFSNYFMGVDNLSEILFSPPSILSMFITVLFAVGFYITCIVIQTRYLNLE